MTFLYLKGCCKGSLLLTAASIMFKPSGNDPLVLEHGQSPFGVIIAMKDIIYAAIVSDFAKLVESSPKLYVVYMNVLSMCWTFLQAA